MTWSKKAGAIGLAVSVITAAFVIYHGHSFLGGGAEYGRLLFAVSLIGAVVATPAIAIRHRTDGWAYRIYLVAFFFVAPLVSEIAVERLNGNFLGELLYYNWIDNYVVILLFYLLLFAISGSVRITVLILAPVFLFFGTVNMYVKEFKGSPLVPMDVGSVATAMTVSSGYTYDIDLELAFSIALTVMICALAVRLAMPEDERRVKIAIRLAALVFPVGFSILFYGTTLLVDMGYKPDFFNQMRGYKQKGAVLEFMVNTRYLHQARPEGYDADEVEEIIATSVGEGEPPDILETALQKGKATAPKETPDIIVIMDEAFSDLSVLGDFTTDRKVLPNMDRLREESVQGNAYVSVYGSGTSNTEFEFLTGNTMAFLPAGSNAYQLYVKGEQPGLVRILKDQGYQAQAFHPYFRDNWNRPTVYDRMGFDGYIGIEEMFSDTFVKTYTEHSDRIYTLRSILREEGAGEDVLLRRYVSDAYDFQEVVRQYEERDPKKPYFMFNVTMQNHSPYDLPYVNRRAGVHLTGDMESYPKAEQYLSLVRQTDQDLGRLVEYFKQVDRPVILLFFGDHQPFIESGFYKDVMGQVTGELSDEDQFKRYQTRFLLWANYEIPSGWVEEISMNYLSTMLLQVAGLSMPDYDRFRAALYPSLPVITAQGCYDEEGHYFATEDAPGKEGEGSQGAVILKDPRSLAEKIDDYRKLAYNNLLDRKNRKDKIFSLKN